MLKKTDIMIIGAVLAAAALLFLGFRLLGGGDTQKQAEIYINGELTYTLPLPDEEQPFYISTETGYNILLLTPDGVSMTDADCPSLDCVHAPGISSGGQVIACLPHRVLVRLKSGDESGVDAVAG